MHRRIRLIKYILTKGVPEEAPAEGLYIPQRQRQSRSHPGFVDGHNLWSIKKQIQRYIAMRILSILLSCNHTINKTLDIYLQVQRQNHLCPCNPGEMCALSKLSQVLSLVLIFIKKTQLSYTIIIFLILQVKILLSIDKKTYSLLSLMVF